MTKALRGAVVTGCPDRAVFLVLGASVVLQVLTGHAELHLAAMRPRPST